MIEPDLVPVTYNRHKNKRWNRFSSYHFAESRRDCPVVLKEIPHVAASYPIVFRQDDQGITPVALFSTDSSETTPFVAPDGRWLASYVPAALRCPPFEAELLDIKTNTYRLLVNENSGLVGTQPEGEAFFDNSRELSQELRRVLDFQKALATEVRTTRALCKVLSDLELYEPLEPNELLPNPIGYLGISLPTSKDISSKTLSTLYDSGALFLIHAHKLYLSHCAWLAHAQEKLANGVFSKQFTNDSDVSDFMKAVGTAHSNDMIAAGEV